MRRGKRWRLRRRLPASASAVLAGIAKSAIAAFGLVALLFIVYEIVETVWLRDAEMAQLHVYHRIRGLLSSLVAALLAAWLILRASPPLFTGEGSNGAVHAAEPHLKASDRDVHFAQWFIRMRWIAVIVATVLVFLAVRVLDYLPDELFQPLMLTVAVLALLNLTYVIVGRERRGGGGLLMTQIVGDLLVLTVLLHFSGGVENPLSTVMLIHVIIAGIVLARRRCYLVAAGASALFAAMVWAEWSEAVPHYTLAVFPHYAHDGAPLHAAHDGAYVLSRVGLHTGILFLTAYFATTVTAQLRRGERRLELVADRVLAQSQLLEQALETTGTALCVYDRQLEPTWSNGRCQALLSQSCGAGCTALPGSDLPARRTLEDGSTRVTEIELPSANGDGAGRSHSRRIVLLTIAPLVDKDGGITHVVELARDITEQKRIQERVARTEKLAAVGELAGRVAHEVNNPIAIVSAKARLLLSDHRTELSERTAGELVKIIDLSDRVARIAQGLLSYCRPIPGPVAPLDIRIPIRKALAIIEPTATEAGIEVAQSIPTDLPDVLVNAGELEQVFLNLFVNALDAMPRGGMLTISAWPDECAGDERGLAVMVEDTGCGIPDEIRERVFEPFLTTKPEGRGTGLGLSICLGLVRGNGGTIELESAPGRGTRVLLRLPLDMTGCREAASHV